MAEPEKEGDIATAIVIRGVTVTHKTHGVVSRVIPGTYASIGRRMGDVKPLVVKLPLENGCTHAS